MSLNTDNLINAKEGLPARMIGRVKVHEWKSKAVVHKKLQTLTLIHDADVNHLVPSWTHSYDIVDVVVKIAEGKITKII